MTGSIASHGEVWTLKHPEPSAGLRVLVVDVPGKPRESVSAFPITGADERFDDFDLLLTEADLREDEGPLRINTTRVVTFPQDWLDQPVNGLTTHGEATLVAWYDSLLQPTDRRRQSAPTAPSVSSRWNPLADAAFDWMDQQLTERLGELPTDAHTEPANGILDQFRTVFERLNLPPAATPRAWAIAGARSVDQPGEAIDVIVIRRTQEFEAIIDLREGGVLRMDLDIYADVNGEVLACFPKAEGAPIQWRDARAVVTLQLSDGSARTEIGTTDASLADLSLALSVLVLFDA